MTDEDFQALDELLAGEPTPGSTPPAAMRAELLDLAEAPRLPIDVSRYEWFDAVPGIRLALVKHDAARGVRACLALGKAGARHPRHRHGGVENILVLEGRLRDERGSYGPGELCRSGAGSIHSEQVVEDCLCYVVYYGELETLEAPKA
jgi:anti-sigma factor ChrR (cupin superfamily)